MISQETWRDMMRGSEAENEESHGNNEAFKKAMKFYENDLEDFRDKK